MTSFVAQNTEYKKTIEEKLTSQFFMHHIGFNLNRIEPGLVEGSCEIKQFLKQQNGFVHGGVTATVADLVMGFAAFTLVSKGKGTVTSDLKIAYLRPGIGEKLEAKGYVVKAGNLLYYCEADIFVRNGSKEILIARGYSTMCSIDIP